MNLPSSRLYAGWLAVVRILTGAIWLMHGVPKFLHGDMFMPPDGFIGQYVTQGLAKTTGPYHDFLANIVQPNLAIFAELVRLGEVCVGISLLLGLFTRLGGFFGIVLTLNYIAARGGLATLSDWSSIDACLMLLSAISLVLPTGRFLGIDRLLTRRYDTEPPLMAEFVQERPLDGPRAPS